MYQTYVNLFIHVSTQTFVNEVLLFIVDKIDYVTSPNLFWDSRP